MLGGLVILHPESHGSRIELLNTFDEIAGVLGRGVAIGRGYRVNGL